MGCNNNINCTCTYFHVHATANVVNVLHITAEVEKCRMLLFKSGEKTYIDQ